MWKKIGEKTVEYKAKLKLVLDKIMLWSNLKKIQNNKIVKSTYIWLAVVPIFAKFTSKLEDTISFTLNDNIHHLDISLPFSWQYFFFSALLFVIGNIIYFLRAPDIIKEYEGWRDYHLSGREFEYLENYMDEEQDAEIQEQRGFKKAIRIMNDQGPESTDQLIKQLKQEFFIVYDGANESNPISRKICFGFYFVAFYLFFVVMIDNIQWVFKQLT